MTDNTFTDEQIKESAKRFSRFMMPKGPSRKKNPKKKTTKEALLATGKPKRFKTGGHQPFLDEKEAKYYASKAVEYDIDMKSEAYIVSEVNRLDKKRKR